MPDKGAKLVVEKRLLQFELNLQNNYKDLAESEYWELLEILDTFLEEKKISERYYRSIKKKLKKYDALYDNADEKDE